MRGSSAANACTAVSARALSEARVMLVERLSSGAGMTVSEFRDMLGTTRKFALPMLEHFDQAKVTRRAGDERVLYKNAMSGNLTSH